jgi:citrate lyase subunit beta/citryl-CoA lyase
VSLVHALPYRSLLYIPAHEAGAYDAARTSGADAVVADLEDFVPAERKEEARRTVAAMFQGAGSGPARLVRINAPETGQSEADLAAIAELDLDALVLPKATPDAIAALGPAGPPLIAVIESAAGLRLAYEVAAAPRVAALALGAFDLAVDLRLRQREDALELLYARSKLVVDSAAAGIRAPFDRVYPHLDDAAGLEADATYARSLGFGGKNCTHASQPSVVNGVF